MSLKLVYPVQSENELNAAVSAQVSEVLLGHQDLCALGKLDVAQIHSLAKRARSEGVKTVLLWDILMSNADLNRCARALAALDLSLFDAIRVLDPGALEYALEKTPLAVQLILRTGNHNLESIRNWVAYSHRIERVILSSELPRKKIAEYAAALNIPVEVLGLVPILLFYSPRHLLTHQTSPNEIARDPESFDMLTAIASCEENTHKGFRVIESRHGTLMFHAKDYSLVDQIEDLKQIGVSAFQVDFRLEASEAQALKQLVQVSKLVHDFDSAHYEEWIQQYPTKVTRCFYQANATDVLFKKLKNTTVQRVDADYLGKVVESVKDQYTIIHVSGAKRSLLPGTEVKIITPMGKTVNVKLSSLKSLEGAPLTQADSGEYAVVPWLRSVTPTSAVYLA